MSECEHDCSSCGVDCPSQTKKSMLVAPHRLSKIQKVIGVCSGKGGVGKSMVTSLLATALRRLGLEVGIMDSDITGPSIPRAFGLSEQALGTDEGFYPVKSQTGIDIMSLNLLMEHDTDPVAWRGPVIAGAVSQFWSDVIWGTKDVMLIDMPPGTGDVMLTIYQTIPIDAVVLVSTPQELVGMIVQKGLKLAKMMNIPVLGIVENMSYVSCPCCEHSFPLFGESHVDEIAKTYGIENLSKLPFDPTLTKLMDCGEIEQYTHSGLDNMANAIVAIKSKHVPIIPLKNTRT